MALFQFVDSISASPTVRLDLNSGPLWVDDDGLDLSPPPLRRAVVSTMLADGDRIPASAWGNRTLKLPIQLVGTTVDAAAATLQQLARELVRDTNILRMQLGTVPYFFRTFAAPDYAFRMPKLLLQYGRAELEIPAEPFAFGLKETLAQVTVNNDPAGSNGMFLDVTSPKGDVETPALFEFPGSGILTDAGGVLAVRRRGTPSSMPLLLQAESMTMGTDTSVQPNDATMSGAGSNYVRVSFAGSTNMQQRAYMEPYPAVDVVDARGTYRLFARVRRSDATSVIKMQSLHGAGGSLAGDPVTVYAQTAAQLVDLGLITIPAGVDPVYDGFSGVQLGVRGGRLGFMAERVSGTGTLDVDYLLLVPADDRLMVIDWGQLGILNKIRIDGPNEMVYGVTNSDLVQHSVSGAAVVGGFVHLSPGVTNRVFFLRTVNLGATGPDSISDTTAITVHYWPRYIYVRPATT